MGPKVLRTFLLGIESSRERKFLKFLELSLPGAKVPGNESSREFFGVKVPVTSEDGVVLAQSTLQVRIQF